MDFNAWHILDTPFLPTPDTMTSVSSLPTEDRQKLLRILGLAIESRKVPSLMKALQAYPDVHSETIEIRATPASNPQSQSVIEACILNDLAIALVPTTTAGGFDINAPVVMGGTVLEYACLRGDASLASLALGLGANPNARPEATDQARIPALSCVVQSLARDASGSGTNRVGLMRMLLGSGADPDVHAEKTMTNVMVIAAADWNGREDMMSGVLADLVRHHADVNVIQGTVAPVSALTLALGKKNVPAILSLVRLGAKTSSEVIGGDIFERFTKLGLKEHIPALTDAIMRRTMDAATTAAKDSSAAITAKRTPIRTTEIL